MLRQPPRRSRSAPGVRFGRLLVGFLASLASLCQNGSQYPTLVATRCTLIVDRCTMIADHSQMHSRDQWLNACGFHPHGSNEILAEILSRARKALSNQ